MKKSSLLERKAALVRKWCLISTTEAGSGHPTSCMSSADIATVLFDKFFTYDIKNPKNPNNDRFILSKGHAAPLQYTLFALSGGLPLSELKTLRKFGSRLEGHPTPYFPFADAATGSLGQGLSAGCGMAVALRAPVENGKLKVESLPKVYVFLGDGESAEGNVWEAANFAAHYKLDNLIAIVDVNRLGQSQETMFGHHAGEYVKRFSSFGFETVEINGHNFEEIEKAFEKAVKNKSGKPFAIIAKTNKGHGVSFLENKDNWHGKPLKKEDLEKALLELGEIDDKLRFSLNRNRSLPHVANDARQPLDGSSSLSSSSLNERRSPKNNNNSDVKTGSTFSSFASGKTSVPFQELTYKLGEEVATREVYGKVLAELGNTNPLIYALDGDTKNSTYSEFFMKAHPDRFIECFIAEQNMVGVAAGLSRMDKIPFVSTFAAFLTRTFDQIRMSTISRSNIKFCGSHAGVSIGEDGPSQMALEDLAMFGAIPDSIIFHPCDGNSTAKIIPHLVSYIGISYIRTLRPKTPVIYSPKEEFVVGGSKILKQSKNDLLTVVACGITVFEALEAYEELKKKNINIRIVDCYSLKPIDGKTLKKCIKETKKKIIITVEDHYEHGGLGDFVLSALATTGAVIEKMAVTKIPRSGTKEDLLDYETISAKYIIKKVKSLI
ncbi:MAG: transketolase [Candidatus Levybacteria bacterium]|nr:transketolase [Candidatus Levybacteria bacterium]